MSLPFSASAGIIGYDFEWTGASNYTMTGMFTFDEADAVDGAIRDGEVASLMYEEFLSGTSIGSTNNAHLLVGSISILTPLPDSSFSMTILTLINHPDGCVLSGASCSRPGY